jgi:hypothetical protein
MSRISDWTHRPCRELQNHLQEITKAAYVEMCGDLTLVHTYRGVDEFSVTSFYQTGSGLGLIGERNIIPHPNSS